MHALRIIWKRTRSVSSSACQSLALWPLRCAAKPKVDLLGREEGHAAFYLPPPRTLYSASASVRERRNNMQVRFQIIRNARISNVGKYQSCMVSKCQLQKVSSPGQYGSVSCTVSCTAGFGKGRRRFRGCIRALDKMAFWRIAADDGCVHATMPYVQ